MTPGAVVRPRRWPPRVWGGPPSIARWERGPPPPRFAPAVMRLCGGRYARGPTFGAMRWGGRVRQAAGGGACRQVAVAPGGGWRARAVVGARGRWRVTLATPAPAAGVVGAGQWPYRYSDRDEGRDRREWADPVAGYPET